MGREIEYSIVDERLDELIKLSERAGVSLDELVNCIGKVDQKTFNACCDKPSILPRYIASSVKP